MSLRSDFFLFLVLISLNLYVLDVSLHVSQGTPISHPRPLHHVTLFEPTLIYVSRNILYNSLNLKLEIRHS